MWLTEKPVCLFLQTPAAVSPGAASRPLNAAASRSRAAGTAFSPTLPAPGGDGRSRAELSAPAAQRGLGRTPTRHGGNARFNALPTVARSPEPRPPVKRPLYDAQLDRQQQQQRQAAAVAPLQPQQEAQSQPGAAPMDWVHETSVVAACGGPSDTTARGQATAELAVVKRQLAEAQQQ